MFLANLRLVTPGNFDSLASFLRRASSAFISRPCLFLLCLFLASKTFGADTYTNPIIADGADPWVIQKDGFYYYTHTTGIDVRIRKASQITGTNGLPSAPALTVFTPPA